MSPNTDEWTSQQYISSSMETALCVREIEKYIFWKKKKTRKRMDK